MYDVYIKIGSPTIVVVHLEIERIRFLIVAMYHLPSRDRSKKKKGDREGWHIPPCSSLVLFRLPDIIHPLWEPRRSGLLEWAWRPSFGIHGSVSVLVFDGCHYSWLLLDKFERRGNCRGVLTCFGWCIGRCEFFEGRFLEALAPEAQL